MANLIEYFLLVFDLTWKLQFVRAKKDFLKQRCAHDGMLQLCFQRYLLGKKVGNIGPYFRRVLVLSWNTIHDRAVIFVCTKMHPKKEQNSENRKEDNAFCGTPRYSYINYPKQVIAVLSFKHFFSFKKCYLDTIGKYKLGQQLGRYR